MRLIRYGVLLLLLSSLAYANQPATGFCTVGAQKVTTSGILSTSQVQASYPACTVTVYLHGTVTPATLYSDNNQPTPTALANPFTANSNGAWLFYAANSRVDIVLSGAGFASPFTISDVVLGDTNQGINDGKYCGGYSGTGNAQMVTCFQALNLIGGGVADVTTMGATIGPLTQDVFSSATSPITIRMTCSQTLSLGIGQTTTVSAPVYITGCANPNFGGVPQAPQYTAARIKATAGMAAMIHATGPMLGPLFTNVDFDCNGVAAIGLEMDRMQAGFWSGIVSVENCTSVQVSLETAAVVADSGSQFNYFGSLLLLNSTSQVGAQCLKLSGNAGNTSNANANVFGMILANYAGNNNCIELDNADSNLFLWTRCFRSSGTGKCLDLGGPSRLDARDNHFVFLDNYLGGMIQRSGNSAANIVDHYMEQNGSPAPTIEGTGTGSEGRMCWTDDSGIRQCSWTGGFIYGYLNNVLGIGQDIALNFNYPTNTASIKVNSSAGGTLDITSPGTRLLNGEVTLANNIRMTAGKADYLDGFTAANFIYYDSGSGFSRWQYNNTLQFVGPHAQFTSATAASNVDLNCTGAGCQDFLNLQVGGVTKYKLILQTDNTVQILNAANQVLLTLGSEYGLGSIPACAAGNVGATASVADSATNTWGDVYAGLGALHVGVRCDGVNWTVTAK